MDLNANGQVDDGSELFGNGAEMIADGSAAGNGFLALGQYDETFTGGNEDGVIDHRDGIWGHLYLWLDRNTNGLSDPGELIHVADAGFTRFGTIPTETKSHYDKHGNWLRYWAKATRLENGQPTTLDMVDVYLLKVKEKDNGNG